jgi:hypothetical protein
MHRGLGGGRLATGRLRPAADSRLADGSVGETVGMRITRLTNALFQEVGEFEGGACATLRVVQFRADSQHDPPNARDGSGDQLPRLGLRRTDRMNDKEKESLYLTLSLMERLLVDLERRVNAADKFLKQAYPAIHSEYLKVLGSVKEEKESIAAQSLERLRRMVFPDNA